MNINANVVESIVKELERNPRTANIIKASTPEVEVEHLDHVLRIAIKNSEDRIQEVSTFRIKRSEQAQISKFQALREKLNLI